jgi:hypothetical protein
MEVAMLRNMMWALAAFTALSFTVPPPDCIAQAPWTLITQDEIARDRTAPHVPAVPDRPPPPTIDLLRPDLTTPLRNPVTIEVRFGAGPGRAIDMQTFRATYGWLGINITNRLLEHAVAGPNSLLAENVDLPLGTHRITLSIADTAGKTASRTFRFSVTQ